MEKVLKSRAGFELGIMRGIKRVQKALTDKEVYLRPLTLFLSVIYFSLIIIPVYAIFRVSGFTSIFNFLGNSDNAAAVRISMQTSLISVLLIFVFCTPVIFYLSAKRNNISTKLLEILVTMPTVLPPAVAGIGLLLAFGRSGFIGRYLANYNIELVFTPAAVILAQFFVASGFYIQVLKTAADAIEPEIYEVSYILGTGRVETFFRIIIPMLKKPLIAGLMLSWTRALGEFGATIMFAGNMSGKTRTMPLQIYTLMQTDILSAASLSTILFVISFIVLFIFKNMFKE